MTPKAWFEEAQRLQHAGRFAEAAAAYRSIPREALSLRAAIGLAGCLMRTGAVPEAQALLERVARQAGADKQVKAMLMTLGVELLAEGRYAEGWPLMEHRVGLANDLIPLVRPDYPHWRGEPLAGKSVLVYVEQGLGDQLMFCRFVDDLADRGARVTLACSPPLAGLFETLRGAASVVPIPLGGAALIPRHDYWTRYFSLPGPLGVTVETLPRGPYLHASSREIPDTGGARFGLAWKTSPTGFHAKAKTLPPGAGEALLALGGISLHPEDTGARDFADTAAIIEQLELVVSVDTSVAHLAGAMGKPVWILLPFAADWRWLKDRADSPWYPTARLFRQTAPGDWGPVLGELGGALAHRFA